MELFTILPMGLRDGRLFWKRRLLIRKQAYSNPVFPLFLRLGTNLIGFVFMVLESDGAIYEKIES